MACSSHFLVKSTLIGCPFVRHALRCPQTMARMVVVNAPAMFESAFTVVKRLLPPDTQKKIKVQGDSMHAKLATSLRPPASDRFWLWGTLGLTVWLRVPLPLLLADPGQELPVRASPAHPPRPADPRTRRQLRSQPGGGIRALAAAAGAEQQQQ